MGLPYPTDGIRIAIPVRLAQVFSWLRNCRRLELGGSCRVWVMFTPEVDRCCQLIAVAIAALDGSNDAASTRATWPLVTE